MSEKDSFIEEVSEELRKDKLVRFIKKYLWIISIIILIIVCIVGINEYRKNNIIKNNQKNGDIIYNFLSVGDENSFNDLKVLASKNEIESIIPRFVLIQKYIEINDLDNSRKLLDSIINFKDIPKDFINLAKLYLFFLEKDTLTKEKLIEDLNSPNNIFRLISLEQKVYMLIEKREYSEANKLIDLILNDIESPNTLKQRIKNIKKIIVQKL